MTTPPREFMKSMPLRKRVISQLSISSWSCPTTAMPSPVPTLVGNGPHELEALKGHGVARHVEQVEVAVFGVAHGGRGVPVRRVIRLSRLDLAHVHEFGRAEKGDAPVDDDRLGEQVLFP